MSLKYNKSTLKKLQDILTSNDYVVRYERGQFKSGYCLLRDKKIIIINKFFDVKGRLDSLIDIMMQVDLNEIKLTDDDRQILKSIEKSLA